MIEEDKKIRNEANIVFNINMNKRGYSYSELAIYLAAFNTNGSLHENWKLKMRMLQPTPKEHPDLFNPPRFLNNSVTARNRSVLRKKPIEELEWKELKLVLENNL